MYTGGKIAWGVREIVALEEGREFTGQDPLVILHVYISAIAMVLQELNLLCIGTGEGFPSAGGYLWDYDNVKTFG